MLSKTRPKDLHWEGRKEGSLKEKKKKRKNCENCEENDPMNPGKESDDLTWMKMKVERMKG